jgi:DivIVA domain-containing protein
MIWALFGVVAIGLVGVVAALVTSRWHYDPMANAVSSVADPGLPDVVHPGDVDNVRFDTALRGYRIDQVDEVLDRLRDRIREQETMIRALRAEHPEVATAGGANAAEHRAVPAPTEPEPTSRPEPATEDDRG